MLLFPKGAPLYTQLPASAHPAPELLGGLARARFSGYAVYTFPTALGVLLFESGRLLAASLSRGGGRLAGFEALADVFQRTVTEQATVDVYRLAPDLVRCLQALLQGEPLYKEQDLKLLDVKALVTKVKGQRLTGCLRIYTSERTALIFYRDGTPLGFFHDGAETIQASATESQQIAKLPGAKVDIYCTPATEGLPSLDLLEMVNVERLWDSSVQRHSAQLKALQAQASVAEQQSREEQLAALEESLKELAAQQVGKLGRALVEKALSERGGRTLLQQPQTTSDFVAAVEKGAKLLAGASKVKALVDGMREQAARYQQRAGAGRTELSFPR
jgi:hypothetical protein